MFLKCIIIMSKLILFSSFTAQINICHQFWYRTLFWNPSLFTISEQAREVDETPLAILKWTKVLHLENAKMCLKHHPFEKRRQKRPIFEMQTPYLSALDFCNFPFWNTPSPWLTRIRFTRISLTRIFKKFPFLT